MRIVLVLPLLALAQTSQTCGTHLQAFQSVINSCRIGRDAFVQTLSNATTLRTFCDGPCTFRLLESMRNATRSCGEKLVQHVIPYAVASPVFCQKDKAGMYCLPRVMTNLNNFHNDNVTSKSVGDYCSDCTRSVLSKLATIPLPEFDIFRKANGICWRDGDKWCAAEVSEILRQLNGTRLSVVFTNGTIRFESRLGNVDLTQLAPLKKSICGSSCIRNAFGFFTTPSPLLMKAFDALCYPVPELNCALGFPFLNNTQCAPLRQIALNETVTGGNCTTVCLDHVKQLSKLGCCVYKLFGQNTGAFLDFAKKCGVGAPVVGCQTPPRINVAKVIRIVTKLNSTWVAKNLGQITEAIRKDVSKRFNVPIESVSAKVIIDAAGNVMIHVQIAVEADLQAKEIVSAKEVDVPLNEFQSLVSDNTSSMNENSGLISYTIEDADVVDVDEQKSNALRNALGMIMVVPIAAAF